MTGKGGPQVPGAGAWRYGDDDRSAEICGQYGDGFHGDEPGRIARHV